MKKPLILILLLLLCNAGLRAVPAYPAKRVLKRADGTTVIATLKGDEYLHYYQSEDGCRFRLEHNDVVTPISDFQFAMMQGEATQQSSATRQRRMANRQRKVSFLGGEKRGLVILVNFKDNDFSIPNPQQVYNDYFNKTGYTDYGMTGSVADYFLDQSYGKFKLNFDVVGPYKLNRSMAAYGGSIDNKHDIDAGSMIADAVELADADVNYRNYDWDGDGQVDQIFVIYAGYGENYGASSDCIWPHESSIESRNITLDGTRISTYACSCELKGTSGTTIDGIGSACHEFSHCLGIADHYDTKGENFGMGAWDVMSSGSYNNESCTPAGYTAYERWVSGWLEPVEISSMTEIKNMKCLEDAPEAYILYNEGNKDEYYLLENRQRKGFDAGLYGHGLLVVHVDYDKSKWTGNAINVGAVQHMTLIAADDEYSEMSVKSLAGDPFPGTTGATSLTDFTTPAAILHNKNSDKSLLMHKPIECIEESESGEISMLLCAEPLHVPEATTFTNVTPTSFRFQWEAVAGASEYELCLDEVARQGSLEESVLLSQDFSSCYSKSASFTDFSTNNMGKYLPGYSGSKLFTTPDYLRIGTGTTTGYLHTPVLRASTTGNVTIVMKVKPFKAGTAVKGKLEIITNTPSTTQSFNFNFEQGSTLVFHSTVAFSEVFRVDITPSSAMYMNGLYVYDGDFSDAELGLDDAKRVQRRVQKMNVKTSDTYYDFAELNPSALYSVKVRAIDSRMRISGWTEWNAVENSTNLPNISGNKEDDGAPYFDLQGRKVAHRTSGIYIHGGKKVMVK